MKILIVITKSEIGGAQVFALNLAKGLKEAGEEVVVAGGPGEYLPEELEKNEISFHRFKNLKRGFNPLKNLTFLSELKSFVREGNFDVVHLNSTNALLGLWALSDLKKDKPNLKIVFTVHGLSLVDGNHQASMPLKKAFSIFFKTAFKKLDRIIFVSQLNLNYAKSIGLLSDKAFLKAELIYNGLYFPEDYFFSRQEAREFLAGKAVPFCYEPEALSKVFLYGSIGRLAYPKNYEFLIAAHKEIKKSLPQAKLLLIGEGPERHKYEAMIETYGVKDSVCLFGELKDASRYLRAFDLFVLPSIFEGTSLSLIEAKRAGVSILASLVGGNEEVVGSGNCFALNDSADFVARVLSLAKKKSESGEEENIGTAPVDSRFEAGEMVAKYLEIYRG